jgi:hypothetical protein
MPGRPFPSDEKDGLTFRATIMKITLIIIFLFLSRYPALHVSRVRNNRTQFKP